MDAAVGRTVAVVVIIDRRLSVVVVAVAVPIGVTGGAAGKGDGGEDENKMSEHGGVPWLSVLQHRPRAWKSCLIAPEWRRASSTVRPFVRYGNANRPAPCIVRRLRIRPAPPPSTRPPPRPRFGGT